MTREFFGYSFATWRFHLRGETIRSAADVGWIRDLTVGQMMRADVRTVPAETHDRRLSRSLSARLDQPVIAVDEDGRYAGMVLAAGGARRRSRRHRLLRDILHHADNVLLPQMTAQEAVAAFDRTETEASPLWTRRTPAAVSGC